MHILPFVSIILIILATLSYSFLDKSKTLIYEKQVAFSHMTLERKLLNKLHREAFKKAPEKKIPVEPAVAAQESPEPSDPTISPRTHSISKMNLFPLLSQNLPKEIEKSFERLLLQLYGTSILKDLPPSEFTSHLIKRGKEQIAAYNTLKKDLSSLRLCDLYPSTSTEHQLFYKMLKGTHSYDLSTQGYPPLEDFFCLDITASHAMLHFPSLPPIMLSALFGQEGCDAILKKEEQLRSQNPDRTLKTLSKEELVALLHEKFPSHSSYDLLMEYFVFGSHSFKKQSITVYDTKTHLYLEKNRF